MTAGVLVRDDVARREAGVRAAIRDTRVITRRNLVRLRRNPATIASAVGFPLIFLFGFFAVLRKTLEAGGLDYAQYMPPIIVVQAMFFTAISSAFFLADDKLFGILERCRALPMHRWAPLLGRVSADVARSVVSLCVVVGVAMILGFRFEAGVLPALGFVGVAIVFTIAASSGCALVGLTAPTPEAAISTLFMPYLPLLMLSSGFVPVEAFPGWLQPFVEWQPVSLTVDALRALAAGGATAEPVGRALVVLAALTTGFAVLGGRVYAGLFGGGGGRTGRVDASGAEDESIVHDARGTGDAPTAHAVAGRSGTAHDTFLAAARNLKVLRRSPMTVVQSVAFPTVLLLVLLAAFGRVVGGSIEAYSARLVPQLVVAGGAFGAAGTGVAVFTDRTSGLLDRLRSMPIARSAYLTGAVAADAARAFVAAVVLTLVGHLFGFRFHEGPLAALGFLGLATLFGTIWAWLAIRLGLSASSPEAVGSTMNGPILMMFFLSTGFVPVDGFPGFLQPVVRVNPLSIAVNALVGLSSGGPVLVPTLQTLAWVTALTLVLAPSAVRRFRLG